ncbi:MAG: hypothetical protein LBL91_05230 [Lachnospiraceae bacterium]|nr:hypothetical protein [Lachnospiraceae bacterium]
MSLFSKSGIVNVKMIITEEKILSNIDRVQKMINPNNKKQIIELEEDAYFIDLIDSIKTYLQEYPKKKNFPEAVYKAAYDLVEYATTQFEDNTKQIEELIRQREKNIALANKLKNIIKSVQGKEKDWKDKVKQAVEDFSEDIISTLNLIGRSKTTKSENYNSALKLVNARVSNLESNLHIEIDMERIEDRSKALSYIGIEVAEALKEIPAPSKKTVTVKATVTEKVKKPTVNTLVKEEQQIAETEYIQDTRVEVKPSLWQRIKTSKVIRIITNLTKIRIRIDVPALPEAREQK